MTYSNYLNFEYEMFELFKFKTLNVRNFTASGQNESLSEYKNRNSKL